MAKPKPSKTLQPTKQLSFAKPSQPDYKNIPPAHLRKLQKRSFLIRSWLVFTLAMLMLAGVYMHNIYLQVYQNKKYELSSINNYIKLIPMPPERGIITDRNGIGLAINRLEYGLFLNAISIKQAHQDFIKLQQILNLPDDYFNNYLKARRNDIFKSATLLKANLDFDQMAKVLDHKYELPQVTIQPMYNRYYPFGTSLPHILGYVGAINDRDQKYIQSLPEAQQTDYAGTQSIGKIGLEKFYEAQLHGTVGYNTVEVNSTGEIVKSIEQQLPIQGDNLRLSIDLPLQMYIKDLVKDQRAAIIATNPRTAEILAIISNPSYDANLFVDGISSKNYNALLKDVNKPLYNRATMGIYPPGSTIKPYFGFTGLADGAITENYTIKDPGYWVLPGSDQTFRDWKHGGHGTVNIHKAIVESVDTYFYDLAYRMGIDKMASYMKQFGFGQKTNIDINEESAAFYPNSAWKLKRFKQPWVLGDTPSVGIGQGYFTATPIQIVNALNTLINHGKMYRPHLVLDTAMKLAPNQYDISATQSDYTTIFKDQPQKYWDIILQGMHGVTSQWNGSGFRSFYGAKYSSGGKSGTAQVFSLNGADYKANEVDKILHDHALFTAFAPFEDPKISVIVIIENGGGGSKVAGPIARKVLDYYLNQRLPDLDPKLTCSVMQQRAIAALADLGYQINIASDLYNLKNLTRNQQACTPDNTTLPTDTASAGDDNNLKQSEQLVTTTQAPLTQVQKATPATGTLLALSPRDNFDTAHNLQVANLRNTTMHNLTITSPVTFTIQYQVQLATPESFSVLSSVPTGHATQIHFSSSRHHSQP